MVNTVLLVVLRIVNSVEAATVASAVVGQRRIWLGTMAEMVSSCLSPSVMVEQRVASSSILRFNGFHTQAATAFLLLNGQANDCGHALFIDIMISYSSMVSFICFFSFGKFSFALANSILYDPFCSLESPTCHKEVP